LRVALIADTHFHVPGVALPPRCAEQIRGADLLLHAGDVSIEESLEEIGRLGPPVRAVHGNVDSPQLQGRLPEVLSVELDGVAITMLHDAGPAGGRLKRMRARFPDSDVVVFGHSHMPLDEEDNGFRIFNPGSPTQRRRSPSHTMGVAEISNGQIDLRHVEV
jgi:uncharacterized protein